MKIVSADPKPYKVLIQTTLNSGGAAHSLVVEFSNERRALEAADIANRPNATRPWIATTATLLFTPAAPGEDV